jgi:hypothetical protein
MDWNLGRWVAGKTASVKLDLDVVLYVDDLTGIAVPSSL